MKIKITIGTANGKKGAVTIDTDELPKKYTALHGDVGVTAEIVESKTPEQKDLEW